MTKLRRKITKIKYKLRLVSVRDDCEYNVGNFAKHT